MPKWFGKRGSGRSVVVRGTTLSAAPAARFSGGGIDIPPEVFGLESYGDTASRVPRRLAMQVPAVKRCRDLIPGVLGQIPFRLLDKDTKEPIASELLDQPERDVPASVTYARTFEDLFFEQVAWWQITEWQTIGGEDWPLHVRRLDPGTVDVTQEGRIYRTAAGHTGSAVEWLDDAELIRFDSPTDGFLTAGAKAIRTALNLMNASANAASGVPPIDWFEPAEGADPAEDDAIAEILADWRTARQQGRTAYVPAALTYKQGGFNPEQLELADIRQHAVLEIARVGGVDPEDLGVSTTSRTYQNDQDRRKQFTDFTIGLYLRAFEDRLSMDDIAPSNVTATGDLSAMLRSDDLTRMQVHEIALRIGAETEPEMRAAEGKPPLTDAERQALPTPAAGPQAVAASNVRHLTFDKPDTPTLRVATATLQFAVDRERRTISGLLVPYGVPGRSMGQWWQFSQGTLTYSDVSRVKLWVMHDPERAVGMATMLDDREDGLYGTFQIARGEAGDEALTMAEDGVWDGFSVGVGQGGKYRRDRNGVNHAVSMPLMETSLTPVPVFDDARVHSVAASAAGTPQGEIRMNKEQRARLKELRAKQDRTEAEDNELLSLLALAADEAEAAEDDPAEETEDTPAEGAADAPAVAASGGTPAARFSGARRQRVSAGRPVTKVREEKPYRFGGPKGKHDFSSDVISALRDGNTEANQRVVTFMATEFPTGPRFDVASADVAALNPARNRPEMYVDNLEYLYPLYDAYYSGSLDDNTPFTFPKFVSSSDATDDHTEGEEPDAMGFVATSQTVTPTATSGKAEIPREIWDAGGNPKVSDLMWKEMQRSWFEALEAKVAALLAAATPGAGGYPAAWALTAGAVDAELVSALQRKLVGLQFIRGGNRFNKAHGHVDLFTNLADAKDDNGRNLLPLISPQNANGQVADKFASLTIGGQKLDPAWALGATADAASKSYLGVADDVHVWASAPQRLQFEYQVKTVDIAIWGYKATAVSRPAGLQVVTYDPTA